MLAVDLAPRPNMVGDFHHTSSRYARFIPELMSIIRCGQLDSAASTTDGANVA